MTCFITGFVNVYAMSGNPSTGSACALTPLPMPFLTPIKTKCRLAKRAGVTPSTLWLVNWLLPLTQIKTLKQSVRLIDRVDWRTVFSTFYTCRVQGWYLVV